MKPVYESSTLIVPSLADHSGRLSIPGAFRLFRISPPRMRRNSGPDIMIC